MRDHTSTMATVSAIDPATYNANSTPITIDRSGYDAVTFALSIGAGGITFTDNNRIDLVLEHSDDGTAWDAVVPTNVLGATPDPFGIVLSQRSAHATPTVHRFGYVDGIAGDRRYVRLRPRFNGTHGTGTPLSAVAILGEARERPTVA